jgi:hypothetical protein
MHARASYQIVSVEERHVPRGRGGAHVQAESKQANVYDSNEKSVFIISYLLQFIRHWFE